MALVGYARFAPKFTQPKQSYSRFRDKYKVVYSENGNKEFVKVGTTDMYDLAQSHKDACSIENIIKRATNDPSVLQRTVGQYMDMTAVPENMFDAMKVISDAKEIFAALPKDQQAAYNYSFDNFIGSFRTATGLAKFVSLNKPKVVENVETTDTVKTEVTE